MILHLYEMLMVDGLSVLEFMGWERLELDMDSVSCVIFEAKEFVFELLEEKLIILMKTGFHFELM